MTIQGASPKIPQHGKADSAGARKLRAAKGKLLDKFEYRDLKPDCARLLVVEKPLDDDEERIVVSFKEVTFDSLGTRKRYQYEALSYHWEGGAREEGMKPIYIEKKPDVADVVVAMKASKNLQNAFYTFYVKPNLYYALRSLRKPDKRVHLWVDAICINQENRDEKSGQIARLAEIYSRAASVAIWLGDSDDPSKRAMAFVKKVIVMDKLEDLVKDKTHMNDWYDLEKLVQRTWFSRRWVIQELAFASKATVHCGTKKLPWKDVRDAISLFEKYIDEIRPLFKGSIEHDHDWYALPDIDHLGASALVKASNNIFRRNRNNTPNGTRWSKTPYEAMQSLEYLVSTLSPFRSSDPRDTVYAFNNIAKDTAPAMLSNTVLEHTHLVVPNYQKTLLEVYLDFVKWVTITTKSIDIICRHWAIPEKLERERDLFYPDLSVLPSWIQQLPNVSFQDTGGSSTHRIIGRSFVGVPGKRVYNACHGLPVQARFARDSPVSLGAMASDSAPTGSKRPNPWIDNASETSTKRRRFDNTPGAQQEEGDADTKQQRPDRNYGMHGGYQRDPEETDEQDATDEESSDSDSSESERIPILSDQFDSDWDPDTALIDRLIKDNRDDVSLYLKGLKIGEVKFRTDEIVGGVILPRALQRLRGTQSKDPDKLWKTLVAERDEHGNNPPPWTERAAEHWLPDPSPDAHINTKELLRKRQPTPVRTFLKRVQNVIWNRSFVEVTRGTTGDPLQGFGPTDVREGDIVCILFGCSVPCVLRKGLDTRAGNYYRFIGEAYLYGIMDGEEVTRRSDQEIETATEEFRLFTRTTLGDLVPGLEKEPPCARANKRRKLNAEDSGDDEMRDDYNGQANGTSGIRDDEPKRHGLVPSQTPGEIRYPIRKLPAEIRNRIYALCLGYESEADFTPMSLVKRSGDGTTTVHHAFPNLLLLAKWIRKEATEMFWEGAAWRDCLDLSLQAGKQWPCAYSIATSFTNDDRAKIKRLRITTTTNLDCPHPIRKPLLSPSPALPPHQDHGAATIPAGHTSIRRIGR